MNKTRPGKGAPAEFLGGVKNGRRRADALRMHELMRQISDDPGRMWGPSIVGFGVHRYRLAGGKTGEICKIGFAPRASAIALYLGSFPERVDSLARLGRHTTGAGCLYVPRLDEVDETVLRELIKAAWKRPDEV